MNKEEIIERKLDVSRILFMSNVPVHRAKIIANFIEDLDQENNQLKEQRQELRSWLEEWLKITEKQYDELKEPVRKSFLKVTIDTLKEVLSKLNELEGKND
jgi:septal ring factor EnvC (AmiA/AmiB activator)